MFISSVKFFLLSDTDSITKLTCLHKRTEHQAARKMFGCVMSIQRGQGCVKEIVHKPS